MDVERAPDPPGEAASAAGQDEGSAGSSAAPTPRLPSISALLNAIQQPADRSSAPTTSLPPCNSFDNPPRSGSFSTSLSPITRSPTSSGTRTQPSSSEFPTVATASPTTVEEAGAAASERHIPVEVSDPRPNQLTSVEFPDGNALRPLPSGLSSASAINGQNGYSYSSARPRSNSISYPPVYEFPSFSRPASAFPGFATSSERGGAAGGPEERRSTVPQVEAERRRDPRLLHSHQGFDPALNRPRALSISTTDEYRPHGTWPGGPSPVDPAPSRHSIAAGRAEQVDIASLRRGSGSGLSSTAPRLAFVMEQPGTLHARPHPPPPGLDPLTAPGSHHPPPPPPHWNGQPPVAPSAMLPPPHPGGAPHPATVGLIPLAIPSGLPLSSPVSPPSAGSSAGPSSATNGVFAAIQPRPGTVLATAAGWGALPGHPGPPPSGQGAADLAYGYEAPQEAAVNEPGRYICPHCSKRFARPSSLRIHMHSHTGEKPFSCPLCDRAFSVQSNLRRHLKIHKGGAVPVVGPSRRGDKLAREQQARAAAAEALQSVAAGGMEVGGSASGAVGAMGEEGEMDEGEGEEMEG
ncbi:hypothetical protein JCM8097_006954 [Rhodosporidiobolus ruineniae]